MGEFLRDRLPDPIHYFSSEGMALVGKGKWRTTACRFHGGSDSMRINIGSGAWVCMNCSARGGDVLAHHMAEHGMDFVDAAKALGAWHDNGKPSKTQRPKPIPATAAIQILAFESNLAAVAAGNLAKGIELTDADRARLHVAARRIHHVAEAFA
jgi:hypothetical protein